MKGHAIAAVILLLGSPAGLFAQESFQQKTWDTLSDRDVSDWGQTALQIQPNHWKHGETDHFIIHYFLGGEPLPDPATGQNARLGSGLDRYCPI